MARRIGIFLLILLAVTGLLVGGLLVWATSETGSKYISGKLRAQMLKDTGLDMSFGDVDLDMFPPRIRVNDITAGEQRGRVKCSIEEAEFAPRPLDLLAWNLSIEEVYLGSPRCNVRLDKTDIDTLEDLLRKRDKSAAQSGLNLEKLPDFDVFAMSNCDMVLDIEDEGRLGKLHFSMKGLGIDVTGGKPGIEVRGLIENAHADWQREKDSVSESLEGLRLRAAVSKNAVDLRHLSAIVAGSNIRLRDAHIPLPVWPQGPDVADISVSIPLDLFNRLPLDLPELSGNAGFLGQMSLRQESDGKTGLSARGRVTLKDSAVDEFIIGDLSGLVSMTPRGVAFAETDIKTADGRLSLNGNIAFDEQMTAEISGYLDGIELGRLLEQLTVSGSFVTSKISGPFKLKGRLKPFKLDGTTRFEVIDHITRTDSFRKPNAPIAIHLPRSTVQGTVSITERYLDTKGLEVSSGASKVLVDMRINFDDSTWRLDAHAKSLHLDDLKKIMGFKVGGRGKVDCLITGLLSDPIIQGAVEFNQFAFEGLIFDNATTDVSFQDGLLSFDGMTVKRDESKASASELLLDFNAKSGLKITTKIEAERIAVEELADIFHIDAEPWGSPTGLLFGRVTIDYDLGQHYLHVDADVVHDELKIFGERFGPDALKLSWDNGALTITEFGLTKGRGTISITGATLADKSMNFIGVASSIDSTTIDNIAFKKLGIRTTGQAFVVVEGSLDNPTGWADVRFGNAVHKGVRYGPTNLKATLDGSSITGRGKILGDDANIEHFELNLDDLKFLVEGFVYDFNVMPLLNIDTQDHKASLHVTGEAALRGSLKGKPNLSGEATLDHVRIAIDNLAFENKRPLEIRAEKSRFHIGKTRFSGPDVVFIVSGMLGLEDLNIRVKGLADLASMSNLTTAIVKSDGTVNFEIKARGSYDAPSLSGTAEVENGVAEIVNFPHRIEKIRGHINLSPKVIRFIDFTARCAEGSVGSSGELRLTKGEITDYQFRLYMNDLELALMEDLTFSASTEKEGLILKSPRKGGLPKVTGDVMIRDLRYTHDIRMFEISDINVDRLSGSRLHTAKPKLIDEKNDVFAFDIRLHGNRNIVARNNLFDVDLAIDDVEKPLRLVGTNQTFGFLGRVLGSRGQVRFGGKRFDIRYAAVDFRDPDRPGNPNFIVTADGQVRDWKVTMTAEGTVDEYSLRFASQPYLPREDVLSLILTGLTQTEQRQFGSSGIPFGELMSQLGPGSDAIPLEFRVYNEYSEKAGAETTRVALGRWITQDVWVSISSSVGQESDVEAHLDYKINDQFSIAAGYENDNEGSVGNVGVDLKFRLEF
ncbi:MAG: hypothetical protein GY854_28585 [Deltaproteobacteria bacterium]|nr:hypothetical protein [Deltaproteobacteria bacterium]